MKGRREMTSEEIRKLEDYLKNKFRNEAINLKKRAKDEDSVEVYMGAEFIAVIYKDEDEGEVSYDMNMAILAMDVNGGTGAA